MKKKTAIESENVLMTFLLMVAQALMSELDFKNKKKESIF